MRYVMLLLTISSLISGADGRKSRSRMRRTESEKNYKRGGSSSLDIVTKLLKGIYILIFAPVLFSFFWSLYRDPATPQILKAMWQIAKKKFLGYLGRPDEFDRSDIEGKRR